MTHGPDDIEHFLRLSTPLLQRFNADPSIPTELTSSSLAEILATAAPFLLVVFGSPEAAAVVMNESFEKLFSRLDDVEQSLDGIEKSILALEAKYDASVLARFTSGIRELRDGLRARSKAFREQLLLGARSKLTELCELPPGLTYGRFPSHGIAAAACFLVGIVDTWYGELESAHRYNLRSLIADPLWAENYLGATFIEALAGPELQRLEDEMRAQIEIERARLHDFFWNKVGAGALAAIGIALFPAGAGATLANASKAISKFDSQDAQEEARKQAIQQLEAQALERRATLLRSLASERLRATE